jgi:sialate O-acetylesterase
VALRGRERGAAGSTLGLPEAPDAPGSWYSGETVSLIEPPLPGASIEQGPRDWQILQQDANGTASIPLRGVYRTNAPEFRVEARVVRESDGAPVTAKTDWTAARLLPDQRWELTLTGIPAGGLYRLETRVWRTNCPDIRPMRGDYVHHLGVGDVWIIAGQSNASGTATGYVEDPPTLGVHLFGNDEQWKLAAHPLEDATRTRHPVTVHGVFQAKSPWLAFGRRLLRETGIPVGLIPTALGGSPLSRWQPGADLYRNMLDMARLSGGGVRGIVWYQGESDCNPRGREDYGARFRRFVEAARADLKRPDLPILTGQLGRYTDAGQDRERHRSWSVVREAQRRAALEIPGVEVIPTIDLELCDEIHLSAPAVVTLGERFAAAALRMVHGRDLPPPGIQLLRTEWVMQPSPTLRVHFQPPPAGWVKVGPVTDFTVEDAMGPVELTAVQLDDRGWVDLRLGRGPAPEGVTLHNHYGANPDYSLRDRDQRPTVAFSRPWRHVAADRLEEH